MRRSGFPLWRLAELLTGNTACFAWSSGLNAATWEMSPDLSIKWLDRLRSVIENNNMMCRQADSEICCPINRSLVMTLTR